MSFEEFHYRVPWRPRTAFPGGHAGKSPGTGFEISGHAPLHAGGDPRRFDIRASLRDPFDRLLVRVYNQAASVPIYGLADVSGSMGFTGDANKWEVLADFVTALAYSAQRAGDSFAFIGCDKQIQPDLSVELTRNRGVATTLAERLRRWRPGGAGSEGLLAAAERLPPTRALVFLVSDFHFPIALLREILSRLSIHCVVPVMLWDSAEARVPRFGIARLRDPESGAQRTLLLRRTLAARLNQSVQARKDRLLACFAEYGIQPLHVHDQFQADAVTRYFHG